MMFKRNLRLFTLQGIPVEINISWLLVLGLMTWSFGTGFYPESYSDIFSPAVIWILSLLTALMLFLSILIHEFSHSIVAVRGGLPIRRITLFMFGGVAQMGREVDEPTLELRMAAAGPLMTLVLVGIFIGLSFLTGRVPFLSVLFFTVGAINIGIFVFNMVPGFPLDGGRILRAIIWKKTGNVRRATSIAAGVGQAFSYVLMAGGAFNLFVYDNYVSGIWMVFIGLFLRQSALKSSRQAASRKSFGELKVRDIMRTDVAVDGLSIDQEGPVVKPEDPLWAIYVPLMQQGRGIIPVAGPDGRLAGFVTRRDFAALLKGISSA